MEYSEVYRKARNVVGEENILDYRPATAEKDPTSDGAGEWVPNTIIVWLKNGDCLWYKAKE